MKLARTTLTVIIVKSVRMDSGEIHGMEGFAMVGGCTCVYELIRILESRERSMV